MLKKYNIYEEFQYVVERPKPAKVCFGSSGERVSTLIPKHINQVSPATYDLSQLESGTFRILNKVRSRKGVGGLTSEVPRFKDKLFMQIPSPAKYDLRKKYVFRQKFDAPFGIKCPQRPFKVKNLPGPGTYTVEERKCRRTRFASNLGKPTMIPTVKVLCQSFFLDKCDRCLVRLTGDFWHRNNTNYLCHTCWTDERYAHEMFSQMDLKQFKKIRTCEFKHNHDGTDAAVKLLTDQHVKKMERLENYLDLFITC